MPKTTKNTTTLLEPNWEIRGDRRARVKLLLKLFPQFEWKSITAPDNRRVRWALSELDQRGVVGDDFIAIERSDGVTRLKIFKGGAGRFTLQAVGGIWQYAIAAKWLDAEETLEVAETYNSGRNDWMYFSKWEDGREEDQEEEGAREDSPGSERIPVLAAGFLPVVGVVGMIVGGAGVGGLPGIFALTAVAVAITSYPILAGRFMARVDGREVQDDENGLVRIS